ncbi:MAG: flagellar FlbD family protein [Lachnospiraceae bacterium]|nr:flagellar FlbD family protein [Lachnospiraceae bacterium]
MIRLTRLNDQEIVINCVQIECIDIIPESKIIMMNGKFYIVKESVEEIIKKSLEYNAKINTISSKMF